MSSSNEDIVQGVVDVFTSALQSALPIAHFSQFYDDAELTESATSLFRDVLGDFQENSKLNFAETAALLPVITQQMQEIIEQWKFKNEDNRTKSEEFVQSQVDFLLRDFRTSSEVKLVAVPDIACKDLKVFLEERMNALIGVFDVLTKPGQLQSLVNIKTELEVQLRALEVEAIDKQKSHLEQKAAEKAAKVLENAKSIIMEMMRQLKSKLEHYEGSDAKGDLVKQTLMEINYYLNGKGSVLREYHPNIYSGILGTTAEIGECLDEDEYEGMTAVEFEEKLREHLEFVFSGDQDIQDEDSSDMESKSISSSNEDDGNEDGDSFSENDEVEEKTPTAIKMELEDLEDEAAEDEVGDGSNDFLATDTKQQEHQFQNVDEMDLEGNEIEMGLASNIIDFTNSNVKHAVVRSGDGNVSLDENETHDTMERNSYSIDLTSYDVDGDATAIENRDDAHDPEADGFLNDLEDGAVGNSNASMATGTCQGQGNDEDEYDEQIGNDKVVDHEKEDVGVMTTMVCCEMMEDGKSKLVQPSAPEMSVAVPLGRNEMSMSMVELKKRKYIKKECRVNLVDIKMFASSSRHVNPIAGPSLSSDRTDLADQNAADNSGSTSKTKTNSRRKSAKVHTSIKPASANRLRPKRRCVVVRTNKTMEDDEFSGSSSEDCEDSTPAHKLDGSKSRQTGKRRLNVDDNDNSKTDKITYLYHAKNGPPMYRCNVCKRKCKQYLLKYHGEYCGKSDDPYSCTECGKTFMSKPNLDIHVRIHTGEKPFKCSKCPETFAHKSNLTAHVRSHIRGTRFCCKVCKLSFTSNHRLHDHIMSLHRDKLPFACNYCDERCRDMTNLKKHVITHADFRPFRCPTCDTTAANKYVLAVHIQKRHSQSKKAAFKLANEAALAYLVEETKDKSIPDISANKINSLVMDHIIKKSNLKLPEMATRRTVPRSSNS